MNFLKEWLVNILFKRNVFFNNKRMKNIDKYYYLYVLFLRWFDFCFEWFYFNLKVLLILFFCILRYLCLKNFMNLFKGLLIFLFYL